VSIAFPKQPVGERIRFVVSELGPKLFRAARPCDLHRFDRVGAYATGCQYAPELAWFHVAISKEVVEDVRFNREHFVLIDMHGRRYRPESELRTSFGPEAPLFPPRGTLDGPQWASGYLVFDRGPRDLRAASLTYQDGRQDVTVAGASTRSYRCESPSRLSFSPRSSVDRAAVS
jgi:hypothetical protein